jgi:hypothetical protein
MKATPPSGPCMPSSTSTGEPQGQVHRPERPPSCTPHPPSRPSHLLSCPRSCSPHPPSCLPTPPPSLPSAGAGTVLLQKLGPQRPAGGPAPASQAEKFLVLTSPTSPSPPAHRSSRTQPQEQCPPLWAIAHPGLEVRGDPRSQAGNGQPPGGADLLG